MGRISWVMTGALLSLTLFSSCTCNKQTEAPPPLQVRKVGPQVSQTKRRPEVAQAPTPTTAAQAEQTAPAEATPTVVVQLPSNFPADVPIFKDAALAQVAELANNAHNVIFRTPAAVNEVATFYEQSMTKGGWKITQQMSHANHAFFTFQKGDMLANVTIAEDIHNPGKQVIAIMYEQQQPLEHDEF
jgi:hypothetical protein